MAKKTQEEQVKAEGAGAFAKEFAKELTNITKEIALEDMPLNTIEDYHAYNKEAKKRKKPVKFIPLSLFPHRKVRFVRMDGQSGNSCHVKFVSGAHYINFDMELQDSVEYELPEPVIEYLNSRKTPKYKQQKFPDGTSTVVWSHDKHRFACQMIA
jgi:hypothetical protein